MSARSTGSQRGRHFRFAPESDGRPLVIADLTRGSGHFNLAQGIIGTASGIGAALRTALFGLIAVSFGRTAAFLSIASVGLLGAAILWLLMPETRPSTGK